MAVCEQFLREVFAQVHVTFSSGLDELVQLDSWFYGHARTDGDCSFWNLLLIFLLKNLWVQEFVEKKIFLQYHACQMQYHK